MATLADVFLIDEAFLAAAVDALLLTAAGVPERAYVSPGEPALDCCPQLTVWSQTISEVGLDAGPGALARPKAINRGDRIVITENIQITRCAPRPKQRGGEVSPPSAADLQACAQTVDEDGWALWLGISEALRYGDLANLCSGAERLGAQKLLPQGGCVGWTFTYRYPIEGGRLGT